MAFGKPTGLCLRHAFIPNSSRRERKLKISVSRHITDSKVDAASPMKPYFSATLGAIKPFFTATLGQSTQRKKEEEYLPQSEEKKLPFSPLHLFSGERSVQMKSLYYPLFGKTPFKAFSYTTQRSF